MEKTFTKMEIAIIKRTAQNVAQFVTKKERFLAQIEKIKASKEELMAEKMKSIEEAVNKTIATKLEKLEAEVAVLQPIIDSFQGPIKSMTGGYTTEDLVDKVTEGTGKIDAQTGKESMVTRFVLKYPDTVVPPCEGADAAPSTPAEPVSETDTTDTPDNPQEADPFAGDPFAGTQADEDGADDAAYEAAKEAAETAFSDDENNW